MRIVPYEARHLLQLQLQAAQRGVAPFVTEAYAKMLESQFAITALVDDQPVAVGGITQLWEHRGLVWAFVGQGAGKHWLGIHRAALQVLEMAPYRRIEADTPVDFKAGHRWLRMLGFTCEAPRMKAFSIDGGDSSLYARVKKWQ